MCNKVRTKYDVVCSHSYRPRHGGIIRDDGKYISRFFLFFFKSPLTAHALSALCLGNTERIVRSLERTGCSVARIVSKLVNSQTIRLYGKRVSSGLVIRQRSAYRSVTNSGTTRPDRSGSRKRPRSSSPMCMMQRGCDYGLHAKVMIPLRGTETVKISSSFGRVRRRIYVNAVRIPDRRR